MVESDKDDPEVKILFKRKLSHYAASATVHELQDLAEKAWPDIEVSADADGDDVTVHAVEWDHNMQYAVACLARIKHPRAAEAMRAALLVLATEEGSRR